MSLTHPVLQRLDDLAAHLSTRPDVLAVLGVGSVGEQTDRVDEHSDVDVFVVVDDGAVGRYAHDVAWLEAVAPVAFWFPHTHDGCKVLFDDGIFVEYAVFTLAELRAVPFAGARVVWRRDDAPDDLLRGAAPPEPRDDSVAFHLGEALTNLLVGVHRELRGEHLTAARFVQSHAVDHVLALAGTHERRDPFDASRRVEQAHPDLPLAAMVPGYGRSAAAAREVLTWLGARYDVPAGIGRPLEELLVRAGA
ncbi:hypothetical protein GCM10028777_00120 [Angustibacter speluncae]